MWTEENLERHYSEMGEIDLTWLSKPSQHQFRWKSLKGPWITSRRRISTGKKLIQDFSGCMPTDVYVSTSSWINPVNLPRLKDTKRPYPILLDHLVVFDIDIRPFCKTKLEQARSATQGVRDWLLENTELDIKHICFSGSKGFHIIARDPDRSLFSEPDPVRREQEVRRSRKELLERVIEAGFPVDSVVTADTRRIIRVPGTLHGATGWQCTIMQEDWLDLPVDEWIDLIPRHSSAIEIPRNPPLSMPTIKWPKFSTKDVGKHSDQGSEYTSIEVSSHVSGTKDRSAIVVWLPQKWGEIKKAVEKANRIFDSMDIGPVAFLSDGVRALAIVPRAIPRDFLLSRLSGAGLNQFEHDIRKFEHAWVRITGRMAQGEWVGEVEPLTVLGYGASERCAHPWSAPHLELCSRLGLPIREGEGEVSGSVEASMRIVVRN